MYHTIELDYYLHTDKLSTWETWGRNLEVAFTHLEFLSYMIIFSFPRATNTVIVVVDLFSHGHRNSSKKKMSRDLYKQLYTKGWTKLSDVLIITMSYYVV